MGTGAKFPVAPVESAPMGMAYHQLSIDICGMHPLSLVANAGSVMLRPDRETRLNTDLYVWYGSGIAEVYRLLKAV